MAADGVPWAVENGAHVSAAVARAAHYAATNGAQGIAQPGDLKVTATSTPSGQVEIAPGSCTIRNHGGEGESYAGLARTETAISISPTGGSTRSDLVIARIIDPDYSPWQPSDVADPVNGPYFDFEVIPGVDPSTTAASDVVSYSAVALARIDMPASTTNVTNAYIVDVRELAQPRRSPDLIRVALTSDPGADDLDSTSWENWPASSAPVFIPEWATEAIIRVKIEGVYAATNTVAGELRAVLSPFGGSVFATTLTSKYSALDVDSRRQYEVSDRVSIPAAHRGTTRYIYPQGIKYAGAPGGSGVLRADSGSSVVYDIEWLEVAT